VGKQGCQRRDIGHDCVVITTNKKPPRKLPGGSGSGNDPFYAAARLRTNTKPATPATASQHVDGSGMGARLKCAPVSGLKPTLPTMTPDRLLPRSPRSVVVLELSVGKSQAELLCEKVP
jgi:hypothetical protein